MTGVGRTENVQVRQKKWEKTIFIITLVLFIAAELFLLWFIWTYVDLQLTSDDSSELVLANLLTKENKILTPDWYYSTEIRFLNTNLVYSFFFRFMNDWHKVRVCSVAVLQAVYILSVFILCRSARHTECFPAATLALVLPLAGEYYDIVQKGAYYIPHIVISFVGIAAIYGILHSSGWKRIVLMLVSFILAVLSCMGGPRQVIILYLPLFLCALVLTFAKVKKSGLNEYLKSKYFPLSIAAVVSMAGAGTGYYINTHYLAERYHFSQWNTIKFRDFDWSRLGQVLDGFLTTYGYGTGNVDAWNALANLVAFALFFGTAASVIYPLRHRDRVSFEYFFLSAFYCSAIFVFIALYALTSMTYLSRYNEPILVFSYLLIAMGIVENGWPEKKKLVICVLYVVALLAGGFHVYTAMRSGIVQSGMHSEKQEIAEQLADSGYDAGYATFWNANIMTELSNGQIDMYCWCDAHDPRALQKISDINTTDQWLQLVSHDTERPDGKVFILLSPAEYENCTWKQNLTEEYLVYSSENYRVFGFDSYAEMADVTGN